ncbi:biopolymer transport protein [Thiovulum sp. ES]|nr:biopolymer transport protein [Thiovulum sp. ES]
MLEALLFFWEYAQNGGIIIIILTLLTIFLWYGLGFRYHLLKRGDGRNLRRLFEKYQSGKFQNRQPKGIVDRAIIEAIQIKNERKNNLREHLDEAFYKYIMEMRSFSGLVQIIVIVAPLLGLLGTVTGMIETFDSLADMALFSQSGGIAGGIAQALFTTQMGLIVSVPGLIIGNMLLRKQEKIETELNQIKDLITSFDESSKINLSKE